jgi:Grx4 family monothiol glutaredoxin
MNSVFSELSRQYPKITFISIDAEIEEDLSEQFEIESVPTFIIQTKTRIVLENPEASILTQKINQITTKASKVIIDIKEDLTKKCKMLTTSHPIMIFIKGTPQVPRCGFSRSLVDILTEQNVTFASFDILSDEPIRQELKKFSNWPTFPQVYVDGEFIGGLDIIKEMVANGEFKDILPKEEDLNTRLGKLVKRSKVMVFIKGNPSTPKCGFSRVLVGILQDQNVDFDHFDILEDDEVRQGLKVFSDWPTFPQLYVNGELIGGLDIVKELINANEFSSILA